MHIAKSYVYRSLDRPGEGYVGRAPRGSVELVARPGAVLTDEAVQELGLSDLEDHTDYNRILAEAVEAGAPITVRIPDPDRDRTMVVSEPQEKAVLKKVRPDGSIEPLKGGSK